MVRGPRWTRDEAIHYLKNNINFLDLQRSQPRARDLGDNSTATLKRYAAGMWQANELEGREVKSLGELRGHTASEHHKGRGPKRGFEHWQPPVKTPRGTFDLPGGAFAAQGVVRVTSSERVAFRFLASLAKTYRKRDGATVRYDPKHTGHLVSMPWLASLHVQGHRVGEQSDLFTKGGWNPESLLDAAGYRRGARGRWYLPAGAQGLERFVVDYIRANSKSPSAKSEWTGVRLWQVFGWAEPEKNATPEWREVAPAAQRR